MAERATTQLKQSGKKQYSAPALDKGLDIIELLASESVGLSLSDIAQKLGRSVGEIFRMIAVLEQRGYLALNSASEKYVLTLKLFSVAHRHLPVKRLTSAALPIMHELTDMLEQSCHLVIYYNGRGLVIAQNDSPALCGISVRLGSEVPLVDSCSGNLLLAYSTPEFRNRMLDNRPKNLDSKINQRKLDSTLNRIHVTGYECIPSTQIRGVHDIGYPVFDHSNSMIAALVVPYIEHLDGSHRVDMDQAQLVLSKAAKALSAALGYNKKI